MEPWVEIGAWCGGARYRLIGGEAGASTPGRAVPGRGAEEHAGGVPHVSVPARGEHALVREWA
jgi:hypothetical protein